MTFGPGIPECLAWIHHGGGLQLSREIALLRLGAKSMAKLGVATQLLAPGDIFQALQLGTLDATEFSLPVMDQKLGFHQVAKFYYFPGWHQQATSSSSTSTRTSGSRSPTSTRR